MYYNIILRTFHLPLVKKVILYMYGVKKNSNQRGVVYLFLDS